MPMPPGGPGFVHMATAMHSGIPGMPSMQVYARTVCVVLQVT